MAVGESTGGENRSFLADPLDQVAPGRGYFGALDSDCLEVGVGTKVAALTLRLADPRPMFLNLSGVELEAEDGPIDLDGVEFQAQASSSVKREGGVPASQLLKGGGLHTQAEVGPWWTVRFGQPVDLARIRVRNRADLWGLRSRSLQVIAEDVDAGPVVLYEGGARAAVLESLRRLNLAAMVAGSPVAALASGRTAVQLRQTLLASLAQRLRAGILPLATTPWRDVVQLLDIWSNHEPGRDEWTALAGFLLAQHGMRRGTAIRALAKVLCTRERLRRLEEEVNVVAAAYARPALTLTRHGFSPVGKLRRNPEIFLDHLGEVVTVLEDMGRKPVLAYGTLLGAVRDGSFITHDDDVDVLYSSPATDRDSVVADLGQVRARLQSLGYRVDSLLPNNLNMHVFHPRSGALMDIFPYWIQADGLMLHMEGMKLRPIRPDIIEPAGSIQLHGRSYPAPGDPVAFLEERYGSGWPVSDPFFEWPWKLEDPEP